MAVGELSPERGDVLGGKVCVKLLRQTGAYKVGTLL